MNVSYRKQMGALVVGQMGALALGFILPLFSCSSALNMQLEKQ